MKSAAFSCCELLRILQRINLFVNVGFKKS